MEADIVPGLLESIETQFDQRTYDSKKLKHALSLLKTKKATYLDANDFAIEVGEILADVLSTNITAKILPDGKMYFNVADRIMNSTMQKNYDLISGFAGDIQTELNHAAGLKIKSQSAPLNQDRIDGIINRVASTENFDDIKWILKEPIVNFSQSVIDDMIQTNVEFQAKSGLHPKITRRVVGRACKWCKSLAGSFEYSQTPDDIYRRHENCRCTVDYDPGSGKKQDVWSKQWRDLNKADKIETRKKFEPKLSSKEFKKTKHSRIRQGQRNISDKNISLALKRPIHKEPIMTDQLGRKSQKVIGEFTTVIVNPDDMTVITTYDTKKRIRAKFMNQGDDK